VAAVVVVVALGMLGAGGYIGSSQAIGNHPEWRAIVHTPADFQLTSEIVAFSSTDGIPLKAWWLPAQSASEAVAQSSPSINIVMVHGRDMNRSGMIPRAAFLVRHGYNVLDVDLRDHGESGGNYITPGSREALDILGAVAYLRQHGEHGRIVAFGYSYGAVAALHAAAQSNDIAAVIADSAFISPDDVLKNVANHPGIPLRFKIGLWFARLPLFDRSTNLMFRLRTGVKLDRKEVSAMAAVQRIRQQPVLFISGQDDWLAPTADTRRMFEAALTSHKRLLVISGAGHDSVYSVAPELYESGVLEFLAEDVRSRTLPAAGAEIAEKGRRLNGGYQANTDIEPLGDSTVKC